jgi:hypothetical protein
VVVLIGLFFMCCCSAAFGGESRDCRNEVDAAVNAFVDSVFETSHRREEFSAEDRDRSYQQAVAKLLAVAKEWGIDTQHIGRICWIHGDYPKAPRRLGSRR